MDKFHIHFCIVASAALGCAISTVATSVLGRALRYGVRRYALPDTPTEEIQIVHKSSPSTFLGRFLGASPVPAALPIDTPALLQRIRNSCKKKLSLIIHTSQAEIPMIEDLCQALLAYKRQGGHITVYVPHQAHYQGTLLALFADRLVCGEGSRFTNIDPQLRIPYTPARWSLWRPRWRRHSWPCICPTSSSC